MSQEFQLAKAYVQFDARDSGATAAGVDKINSAFRQTKTAANDAVGSVKKAEEGLHGVLTNLRGFRELIGLSFGIGIGRQLFEQIHEAGSAFAEEVAAARAAGLGFGDSFASGFEKLIGIQTELEKVLEIQKKTKEVAEETGKAWENIAAVIAQSQGAVKQFDFPNVAGGDAALEKAHKAYVDAAEAARPAQEDVDKKRRELAEAGGKGFVVANQAREELATLMESNAKLFKERENAETEYRQSLADLTAEQNRVKATLTTDKAIEGFVTNGLGLGTDDTTMGLLRKAGLIGEGQLGADTQGVRQTAHTVVDALWTTIGSLVDNSGLTGTKNEREFAERNRKQNEADNQVFDRIFQENAQNKREAQSILDKSDPLAAFKHDAEKIEGLVGSGDLSRSQADKAESRMMKEMSEKEAQHPEFLSAQQYAQRIQTSLTDKPEKLLPTQLQMLGVLSDIKTKIGAQAAVMT